MTVKDIAVVAGMTAETVRVKAKTLFPEKFENGKKTLFTQAEAVKIMGELRKKLMLYTRKE